MIKINLPHGREDEKQLDEHGAEWEYSADQRAEPRRHVPRLRRDLPRDLIRAHGRLRRRRLEPKVRADVHQRRVDGAPEEEQSDEGACKRKKQNTSVQLPIQK